MMDYQLIRARRRTISLAVTWEQRVVVRAPLRMPKRDIDLFVERHAAWIEKHAMQLRTQQEQSPPPLTAPQIATLRQRAKAQLPPRVAQFAAQMGVQPTGITITSAVGRWGSCSGKNRLSFPYRLVLLPPTLVDYIIVHELAHIVEKNHSPRFYAVVERYLPDYKERQTQLKKMQGSIPLPQ